MAEYISTFTPGFERTVAQQLPVLLVHCRVLQSYSGMIHYRYDGEMASVANVPLFNNTYRVLKRFEGAGLSFDMMVKRTRGCAYPFLPEGQGTFRIRYSQENRFCAVSPQVAATAERQIADQTGLRVDRANPQHEFWYIIRREGVGYYGFLLGKRRATEKSLHKGELRPEFACLMALYADIHPGDTVCEPFAGYGAIAVQILAHHPIRRIFVSDVEPEKAAYLKKRLKRWQNKTITRGADAHELAHIPDAAVDIVITDPPWGIYDRLEDITAFYGRFLAQCLRIVKKGGAIVVLTASKAEFEAALVPYPALRRVDTINVLVNGKKANLYKLAVRP